MERAVDNVLMTDSDEPVHGAGRRLLGIGTILVLTITAVLTAWCGFEASKWGGEMSIAFSKASSARVQATAAELTSQTARQYDLTLYVEWVLAEERGDDDLATFIEQRFTPEFGVAFDAWTAEGREAAGPFAMEEYVPPGTERAEELHRSADEHFADALVNNQRGDDYSLLTVLFALVLFFTALSQTQRSDRRRSIFFGIGTVLWVVGMVILTTFPIKI